MAKQLTVLLDNKPGRLNAVTKVLSENKINIRAIAIQDRKDFGVMKVLVNDPIKAEKSLSEKGFACAVKDIVAVAMNDQPGGLYELTQALAANNINISDAYGFVIESSKKAVLCIESINVEETGKTITNAGFSLISDKELYEL